MVGARQAEVGTLRLAVPLAFAVTGWEHWLHLGWTELQAYPLNEGLHWMISDSLLASPLAAAAVWAGRRVTNRLDLAPGSVTRVMVFAGLIAALFAVLLVPGEVLQQAADRLTHAHAMTSHGHSGLLPTRDCASIVACIQVRQASSLAGLIVFAGTSLTDGLTGQIIGFPLIPLALLLAGRTRDARLVRQDAPSKLDMEERHAWQHEGSF